MGESDIATKTWSSDVRKWLLTFVLQTGLATVYVADTEDQCYEVGAALYEEYNRRAYLCSDVAVEMLMDLVINELDTPVLTRDYIKAAQDAVVLDPDTQEMDDGEISEDPDF